MNTAAEFIGKVIGVLAIACVLTAIPMVVRALIGRPLSRPQLIATFIVAVTIVLVLQLLGWLLR